MPSGTAAMTTSRKSRLLNERRHQGGGSVDQARLTARMSVAMNRITDQPSSANANRLAGPRPFAMPAMV